MSDSICEARETPRPVPTVWRRLLGILLADYTVETRRCVHSGEFTEGRPWTWYQLDGLGCFGVSWDVGPLIQGLGWSSHVVRVLRSAGYAASATCQPRDLPRSEQGILLYRAGKELGVVWCAAQPSISHLVLEEQLQGVRSPVALHGLGRWHEADTDKGRVLLTHVALVTARGRCLARVQRSEAGEIIVHGEDKMSTEMFPLELVLGEIPLTPEEVLRVLDGEPLAIAGLLESTPLLRVGGRALARLQLTLEDGQLVGQVIREEDAGQETFPDDARIDSREAEPLEDSY